MKLISPFSSFGVLSTLCLLVTHARADLVTGTVVGPDGKPVQATIYVIPKKGDAVKQSQSTADGSFQVDIDLPKLPSGKPRPVDGIFPANIAFFAPGLGPTFFNIKDATPITIKMLPSRKLMGVLRDEKGKTVAGATIHIASIYNFSQDEGVNQFYYQASGDIQKLLTANTDAAGVWQIMAPPRTTLVVTLDDEKYVPAQIQFYREDGPDHGPGGQDKLVAKLAGSLSGRVLNADGKPAANVPVLAALQSSDNQMLREGGQATTAADGSFRISRLAPGTYNALLGGNFSPWLPRELVSQIKKSPTYIAPAVEGLVVSTGRNSRVPDFKLVQPAIVKGRVFDRATGKALKDIPVGAFGRNSPRSAGVLPVTRTDAEGRFELSLVPGANAIYAFELDPFGRSGPVDVKATPTVVQADTQKSLSVWIDRRFADVKGKIVDEAGKPVAGAEITAWNKRGTGRSLTSDEAGNFSVPEIPMGEHRLDARDKWTLIRPKNLTVKAGAEQNFEIVVRRNAMAQVKGRVVDEAGNPVEGAKLKMRMPYDFDGHGGYTILSKTSNEKGEFTFEALKLPNALQLSTDAVSKDGFKLLTKAAVPATASEKSTSFQLTDIVLQSLRNDLTGTVLDANGKPAAGAIVTSSGDNYETTASTDEAGHFVLKAQPGGKVQLLAAKGLAWTKVSAASDGATLTLGSESPAPAQDVARAIALFREVAKAGEERSSWEAVTTLAPIDPAVALELLTTSGIKIDSDAAKTQIIRQLNANSSQEALRWAQEQLPEIKGDEKFVEAAVFLGLTLSKNNPEAAKAIFVQAQRRTPANTLTSTARLAALAARLDLPEATTLLNKVLGATTQNAAELSGVVESLSMGTAELADEVLALLPEGRESNINSYRTAIHEVAKYDVPGAQKLLEEMRVLVDAVPDLPDENGQLRGRASREFDWAFAAKDVLRAMDHKDAKKAGEIAQRVQQWHRVSAFALAAEFGTPEERLGMAEETIAQENRGDWMKGMTVPRVAALVAEFNPDRATEMFKESGESIAKRRQESSDDPAADWGFYAGFWNPAQARLFLESAWERLENKTLNADEQKYSPKVWQRSALVKAMSSIDVDRALEWARTNSGEDAKQANDIKGGSLLFIGEVLLKSPEQRRLMVIGSESGFDS